MIEWEKEVWNWGKPDIPTTPLPLIWSGYPNTGARYSRGKCKRKRNACLTSCGERHGLTLLPQDTDEGHIHVFVSAPPRFSPALIANFLKGHSSRYLREKFLRLKKVCGKEHLPARLMS